MDQLTKARAVAILAEITKKDSIGRAIRVDTSGGGKRGYTVELEWGMTLVRTSCHCRGSARGLCFHQIGAAIKAVEELGGMVAVSPNLGNLKRLQRTGGNLISIMSNGKVHFMLVKGELQFTNKTVVESPDLPGELLPDHQYIKTNG